MGKIPLDSFITDQESTAMKYYACTLVCLIASFSGISTTKAAEWKPLIGKSLSEHWRTDGHWELHDDGVIHLPDQEYKHWRHYKNYLILKDILLNDFEIAFDWRVAENSGLYFHIPDLKNLEERKHKEVQLYENSKWNKPEFGDHTAGGIIPGHAPTKDVSNPSSAWNHMDIKCVGNHITVAINGTIVTEADLSEGKAGERSTYGGFAFQDHGHAVWLRNIKLKNLDNATQR